MMTKNNRKKEILIRICPKCGSENIWYYAKSNNYICESCAFCSPLFPQIDLKNMRKLKYHPVKYPAALAPVSKPFSVPVFLFLMFMVSIIYVLLIMFR